MSLSSSKMFVVMCSKITVKITTTLLQSRFNHMNSRTMLLLSHKYSELVRHPKTSLLLLKWSNDCMCRIQVLVKDIALNYRPAR